MAKLSGVTDVKNIIKGPDEPKAIVGGNLADRLYGNAQADYILAGAGNDYIWAGAGWNNIDAGAGDDTIIGGVDNDRYTVNAAEGNDTIIDKGGRDSLVVNFVTNSTSGVFIKRGSDLILAEGTVNLTGDADGDGDDTEDLATEIAGIQALASAAARQAGMRSIVSNLTNSATIKGFFINNRQVETIIAADSSVIYGQTIMPNLVDYNTGLKVNSTAVVEASVVRGTHANDHLVAYSNGQVLRGGNGDDYYYIDAKTDVIIEDIGTNTTTGDKIIFGDNNGGAGGTYVYTKEGNNLKITFDDGSGGDIDASVIVKNFYLRTNAQIERVGCDLDGDISAGIAYDATNVQSVCDKVSALTSATRVLRGSIADDKLTVAAGQTVYGFKGNDEYTVTAGKVVIVDTGSAPVLFGDIGDILNADHLATENDGVFIKRGNDLIIVDGTDAVTGYADADAAVADLTNLTNAQKRVVMRNLTKMTDSVTIRNYFSNNRTIEAINAANNNEIIDQEIITNAINYSTGNLAFNQHAATAKRVNGTGADDYIIANANEQKLYGGYGNDVYAIPGGVTDVEIYDKYGSDDKIVFTDADLNGADSYTVEKIGNDVRISVTDVGEGDSSVIIKNFYSNDNYMVEHIEDFDAGTSDDLLWFGVYLYTYGTSGDDTISVTWGKSNQIYAGAGNDLVYGTKTNDHIYGEAGDDTLNSGSARYNDYLYGGEGSDVYELLSGDLNDRIEEVDATADDTDKVVFTGADFSLATSSIDLTRSGDDLLVTVDEGDGISANVTVTDYYAGGSSQIEVIEDGYGNSYNISTNSVSGTFNAAIVLAADNNGTTFAGVTGVDTTVTGGSGNDVFVGRSGNDTFDGGDGADVIDGLSGNDYINGGAGDDLLLQGGDGDDTIEGGLGDDTLDGEADNDVYLYKLDDGTAAGNDAVVSFTIGEDVVRFTTSANDTLGLDYRNHIAVRDTGVGLEIGYGWDESAQDYANKINITAYDDASVSTANVIEFVTADGTTALTAAEITAILADIAADGDAPGTLAAIHDDIDAGAGGNDGQLLVDSINAAW